MKTRTLKALTEFTAAAVLSFSPMFAGAADAPPKSGAKATPLLTEDLPDIAGKEGLMLTVEYPPGGSSPPHRHNADVFVYVLEGSVIMQVEGKEPVTLKPGQTFHEKPTDIHKTSANASKTAPAKFLVFIVKDKGKAVTEAVHEGH